MSNPLSLPEGELRVARCDLLDKLIAVGDGDSALLYLYILRNGDNADDKTVMRALRMTKDRYERAVFTLNGLITPAAPQENPASAPDKPAPPQYGADEMRRARQDDHKFAAVCQSAEETLGRTLTEGQLRCLLTAYDHLGMDAGAIIELLAFLKREKGAVRLADIRRETYLWADMGITTARQAQDYVSRKDAQKPLAEAMLRAVGAGADGPSPKQQRVCSFALSRGFPPETLALAVERTRRKQGHTSLDYTLGILRDWDQKNVHTVSEVTALEPETRTGAQSSAAVAAGADAQPTSSAQLAEWEADWAQRVRRHKEKTEGF